MKARIVIAEGNPELSHFIATLLRQRGYQTIEVHEATSALMLIRCMQPDLVVLALDLPGMSGIALTQVLASNAQTALLPIVMLAAKARQRELAAWLTGGYHDALAKPFAPHDLITKVERMLAFVRERPL